MYIPIDPPSFSDDPRLCIRRTTRDFCPYRTSHAGCRFGSSGSNGFVVGLRCLRLSNCGPMPKVRKNWRFCVGYGLLWLTCDYQLVIGLCKFTQNFNNDCSKNRNSDRSFSTTRPNSLKRYLDFVLSITSY